MDNKAARQLNNYLILMTINLISNDIQWSKFLLKIVQVAEEAQDGWLSYPLEPHYPLEGILEVQVNIVVKQHSSKNFCFKGH